MSDIDKMESYVEKSFTKRAKPQYYELYFSEVVALGDLGDSNCWEMISLAFRYGRAKGYRMGKKEARK